MIDKLKEIIQYHNSLESEMVNPDILNDKNRYTEITKEYHHLNPIVEKSKNYISIWEQINEDKEILAGDDEELKDIVKLTLSKLSSLSVSNDEINESIKKIDKKIIN